MLKPIKTEAEYSNALSRIYDLMQTEVKENSASLDELEILSILVKAYELVHYPIPVPSLLQAIRFRLDQMGISEKELRNLLGYRSRKSEILSGKRKLSLALIRKLNEVLHIPAGILIKAY